MADEKNAVELMKMLADSFNLEFGRLTIHMSGGKVVHASVEHTLKRADPAQVRVGSA